MFRFNPFAKQPQQEVRRRPGGGRTPVSPFTNTPIPEDEAAPSTPIPQRPPLQTGDSWNDPPMAWSSQMAAYDVNPKYTTANNSYTHRRRKSSMMKDLVMGGEEVRYQPQYEDWRRSISAPGSPKASAYSKAQIRRRCSVVKMLASILLIFSVLLGGMCIFAGEMPLVNVSTLPKSYELSEKLSNSSSDAGQYFKQATSNIDLSKVKGEVDWRTWKIQENIKETWKMNERFHNGLKKVRRWISIPDKLRRSEKPWTGQSSDDSPTSIPKSSPTLNTELLMSFAPETIGTRTKATTPSDAIKRGSDESTQAADTVLGHPVQVRQEPSGTEIPIAEPLSTSTAEQKEVEPERSAYQKRVEDMLRRHASYAPADSNAEQVSSVAGTLADGVSPSTET